MDERENRDDLIKRVVEQKEKDGRRVVSGREKAEIARDIEKNVMPRVEEK